MTNRSHQISRVLTFAVTVSVVMAATALAQVRNDYYDSNATTGGLQKVCDNFSINSSDVLSASCNQVTAGIISKVNRSIDLSPDLDDECLGKFKSLEPRVNSVRIEYDCDLHTDDLNDMARWDASDGRLKLTAA